VKKSLSQKLRASSNRSSRSTASLRSKRFVERFKYIGWRRPNRQFLPGHVWHITHSTSEGLFKPFKSFNRFAPFKTVKSELGIKVVHRAVEQAGGTSVLRERSEAYGGIRQ
jgi:hypothetical protein